MPVDNGAIPDQPPFRPVWVNPLKKNLQAHFIDDGKRGEELFHLILSGIREIYEIDAVIAGGAVRDLAAGIKEVKDVDVFLPMKWKDFNKEKEYLGWQGPTIPVKIGGYTTGVGLNFPTTARGSSVVQNVPLDLVFMDKPLTEEDVETFPVFAQRGIWSLGKGMQLSPEARTDIKNETFTIDPKITDKDKIKKVLDKVNGWRRRNDYKNWTIVEPDIKEWWEAKEEAKIQEEKVKEKPLRDLYMDYFEDKPGAAEILRARGLIH